MISVKPGLRLCALVLPLVPTTVTAQASDAWSPRVILKDNTPSIQEPGGEFLAPVHATLLPDGRVLVFGFRQPVESPTIPIARQHTFTAVLTTEQLAFRPTAVSTIQVPVVSDPPYRFTTLQTSPVLNIALDTIFCSGHALEPDGTVFVAGGLRKTFLRTDTALFAATGGLEYAVRWDRNTNSWSPRQNLIGNGSMGNEAPPFYTGPERYYPTVTKLADGRMMTTSGIQILEGAIAAGGVTTNYNGEKNLSVETWDPATSTASLLSNDPIFTSSPPSSPDEIFNNDYAHVFTLPNPVQVGGDTFDVAIFGWEGEPVLMSSTSLPRWAGPFLQRPAAIPQSKPNKGASSLLLPIRLGGTNAFPYANGSMMCVGGGEMMAHLRQFDVWDPTTQSWATTANLAVNRHHASTVLLPDGQVMVVAGHDTPSTQTIVHQQAEYVDPRNNFSVTTGTANGYTVRGYHTVSLLLPDGRVLVGGGRIGGTSLLAPGTIMERANLEFVEPPYYSRPRPKIIAAPSSIRYGQRFNIRADRGVREIVLISLGSMTHSIDMNQRYVQLRKTDAVLLPVESGQDGDAIFQLIQGSRAPANSNIAPPGHYMLFVLDNSLTPSVAKIVHLGP